jgi:hypothetical protein
LLTAASLQIVAPSSANAGTAITPLQVLVLDGSSHVDTSSISSPHWRRFRRPLRSPGRHRASTGQGTSTSLILKGFINLRAAGRISRPFLISAVTARFQGK